VLGAKKAAQAPCEAGVGGRTGDRRGEVSVAVASGNCVDESLRVEGEAPVAVRSQRMARCVS
jgi:hypothetical protein